MTVEFSYHALFNPENRVRMKVFMMKPSTCEPVTNISSYEIENAQIESAEKASLLQKE